MGAWGVSIFADDLAVDIKDEYLALLVKYTDEEAEQKILEEYEETLKGTEDEPVLWFALALIEWRKGRLTEKVKAKALEWIERGGDLERWEAPGNEGNVRKRKKELDKLKVKLQEPMPERKKVKKPTVVHSPWEVGDLLAYRLSYEGIEHKELIGQYVLLRVLKNLKHQVSRYLDDYNETVLLGLYNWYGKEIPDKTRMKEMEYSIIDDYYDIIRGRRLETCMNLSFNKNEVAQHDVFVIDNDDMYKLKTPKFFDIRLTNFSWYSFDNMEFWISRALLGHPQEVE